MTVEHLHRWARRRDGRRCIDCDHVEQGEFPREHQHRLYPWLTFHRAPTGPYPEHTTVLLLFCVDCGEHEFFPPDNWILCTPDFRSAVEQLVAEAGAFLATRP